jgi:hypothetical protein
MKAPFPTPVTEDDLIDSFTEGDPIDLFKPDHAAFVLTAINSHEALLSALGRALPHLAEIRDHACKECVPHGESVMPGFLCVKHFAPKALALAKEKS